MEYMQLMGAESVRSAAVSISDAAARMESVACSFAESIERLRQVLEDDRQQRAADAEREKGGSDDHRNGMMFESEPSGPWPIEFDIADRLEELAARVRDLEGRTCDRCEFRIAGKDRRDGIPEDGCLLTQHEGNDDFVDCGTFGNTCGAFKEKTP